MDSELANKTILVTGGSGGIGQAIVKTMVGEGAKVVIHCLGGLDRARALAEQLPTDQTCIVQADLVDEQQVAKLFDAAESVFGQVDVLVANAGKWPEANTPIHQMSLERWKETIDVNSTSIFLCVREYLKRAFVNDLVDPSIVVTGSTAGKFGEANHADYATAKSSFMYGMVNSLKNEIAHVNPNGRINAVCPGWTLTPMARSVTNNKGAMKKVLQTIPLRKVASSQDIANAVTFLASSKLSGHITGQTLFVDGGMEGRVLNDPSDIDLDRALPKYD